MAKPKVELTNSFNEWRIITNTLSDEIGDFALIYDVTKVDAISALNDLNTRKYNSEGGAISGAVTMGLTLTVTGATILSSTANVLGNFSVNTNKFNVVAASGNTAIAGTLGVTLATTLSATLDVTGNLNVNTNKFNVVAASGNTAIAGTLAVVGVTTLAATGVTTLAASGAVVFSTTLGVTGNLNVNTNKFNVVAASGNTSIAGTLAVTGVTSLSNSIVSTTGTIVASTPIISATQTWNAAGTAFRAISVDITNTASAVGSLLVDLKLGGVTKFGIAANGTISQSLSGNNLARDIVTGTRHIREYQDLQDAGIQGLGAAYNEWGFTWNASWNGASYVKDRNNAGDHALMTRTDSQFSEQWWFSDGTTPGAIAWVKKIDYNFPNSTYWFDGALTVTTLNTNNLVTTGSVTVGSVSSFADYIVVTATVAPTILATIDAAVYRSATFEIQAYDATSGKYHKTLISAIHNGTIADSVEYGTVAVAGICGTFTATYSGGNVLLTVTPTSANSTSFKIHSRLMKV